MEIVYLLTGLLKGFIMGVLYTRNKSQKNEEDKSKINFVSIELYQTEKNRVEKIEEENKEMHQYIGDLKADVSARDANIMHLKQKINTEGERLLEQQKQLEFKFEQMANKILEQKIWHL